MEIRFPKYTAILELMTTNTYVLIVVADPEVRKLHAKLSCSTLGVSCRLAAHEHSFVTLLQNRPR